MTSPADRKGRARGSGAAWLLAPYLAGSLLLVALPALASLALAFFRYDALSPPAWVGWKNFQDLLRDPLLPVAVHNSALFTLLAVPARVGGALALALLLERPRRGTGIYRAAVYLPTVVPEAAFAVIGLWILNPFYGPLNGALRSLGLPTPAWLVDPALAKPALALLSVLQIGEGFVVLLTGLKEIPREYSESAAAAGATRLQTFRAVTLPLLAPWLALLSVRDVIFSFQYTFTLAYLMTGGDPYYATFFYPLWIYEEAFDRLRFGLGSALMVLLLLFTALLIAAVYAAFRRWSYSDEE